MTNNKFWKWVVFEVDNSRYLLWLLIILVGALLIVCIERGWLVNNNTTDVIIWTAGVFWVVWQFYANHRQTLRLRIYEKIADSVLDAKVMTSSFITECELTEPIISHIERDLQMHRKNIWIFKNAPIDDMAKNYSVEQLNILIQGDIANIGHKLSGLLEFNKKLHETITNTIYSIERYEIAIPRFEVFKEELGKISKLITDSFHEYHGALSKLYELIEDNYRGGEDRNYEIRKELILRQIKENKIGLRNNIMDLSSYIYDIEREAQNDLIGKLFRNLSGRRPTGTHHKIITTRSG